MAGELLRVAGAEAAAALITAWAGQRFRVPFVPGGRGRDGDVAWARLVEVVGEAAAQAIVRRWRGGELYIPRCTDAVRAHLHDIIRAEYDVLTGQGYTGRQATFELGTRYALSYRSVERLLVKPDNQTASQMTLFDAPRRHTSAARPDTGGEQ
jgi:hypothetical protein